MTQQYWEWLEWGALSYTTSKPKLQTKTSVNEAVRVSVLYDCRCVDCYLIVCPCLKLVEKC